MSTPLSNELPWIADKLPAVFSRWQMAGLYLWQWLGLFAVVILAWLGARLTVWLLMRIGHRLAAHTRTRRDDQLLDKLREPGRLFVGIVFAWGLVAPLALPAPAQAVAGKTLGVVLVFAVAWFLVRLVHFVGDAIEEHAVEQAKDGGDELHERGVRTQVAVLRRVASILVGILAVSLALLQFDVVRTVGMSLLASAGIAGIVIGLAAQKSIATLLAGIQLSITQPIRIGDTVIVEGEWGTIEEINLTYVVVKVWDLRRLIVPMTRFLNHSFQNWTKVSPELLGTVYLYADYRLPVDAVRAELDRILEGNPKWDEKAKGVVVTNAKEQVIEVRPLVSATNAGDLWDLRCEVREKLVTWLGRYENGRFLPRARVEMEPDGAASSRGRTEDGAAAAAAGAGNA